MENFKWDDKEFEFAKLTGEVFSNNKFSETHVSSSGGGGHVDPQYGGHVAAAQVSSTVTTVHEFWIKDDKGEEHPVNLRGHDIPLALGQKITLISSGLVGAPQHHYVLIYNHNAKKYWALQKAIGLHAAYSEQSVMKFLIKILIAIAIYIILLNITGGYVTWAMHIWLVYYCIRFYMHRNKMEKALDAHIEKIAQDTFFKTS